MRLAMSVKLVCPGKVNVPAAIDPASAARDSADKAVAGTSGEVKNPLISEAFDADGNLRDEWARVAKRTAPGVAQVVSRHQVSLTTVAASAGRIEPDAGYSTLLKCTFENFGSSEVVLVGRTIVAIEQNGRVQVCPKSCALPLAFVYCVKFTAVKILIPRSKFRPFHFLGCQWHGVEPPAIVLRRLHVFRHLMLPSTLFAPGLQLSGASKHWRMPCAEQVEKHLSGTCTRGLRNPTRVENGLILKTPIVHVFKQAKPGSGSGAPVGGHGSVSVTPVGGRGQHLCLGSTPRASITVIAE